MQLRWKASFSASCLHLAASMQEGLPIADSAVAQQLQAPVEALVDELDASGLPAETTLPQLVSLAADYENNRQLIEMAGTRTRGAGALSASSVSLLAGCLSDLEAAWLRVAPNLVDELAVRGRPLREQWEARGPGLLRAVARLAGDEFVAPSAEVVLVSPVVGGHGRAHLRNNRVTMEAVLTNPIPSLPEVVRLGWLLAQLQLDLPILGESVSQHRLPQLASLATVPLILKAADMVDLAKLDETTVEQALQAWHVPLPSDESGRKLLDWWQTLHASDTRWPVALAALDQMFSA